MVNLAKLDLVGIRTDGERSNLRHIRCDDKEELARLWEMEKDPLINKFVEDLAESEEEMESFLKVDKNYLVLAVEGKRGHVEESEVGRLQGWIAIYLDDKRRLKRLRQMTSARVLEIGFARYPKAKSGQMASSLRQVIRLLCREHEKVNCTLMITAYADETNQASVNVLKACGFEHKGLVKYRVKNKALDHFFSYRPGQRIGSYPSTDQ